MNDEPTPEPTPQTPSNNPETLAADPTATIGEPVATPIVTVGEATPHPEESASASSTLGRTAEGFAGVFAFLFSWIIFPVVAVLILHFFVFSAYHVVGTSMSNTLHPTDYLIISKVSSTEALIQRDILHHNVLYVPKRDQIIVFHYPGDPTEIFVKRVIGLPGDHVIVKGGSVTIINSAHPKGFDPNTGYEATNTATLGNVDEIVPAGNVFVLGDNRTEGGSFDSRDWGNLPSSYIIGNAVLRLWPLTSVKLF